MLLCVKCNAKNASFLCADLDQSLLLVDGLDLDPLKEKRSQGQDPQGNLGAPDHGRDHQGDLLEDLGRGHPKSQDAQGPDQDLHPGRSQGDQGLDHPGERKAPGVKFLKICFCLSDLAK